MEKYNFLSNSGEKSFLPADNDPFPCYRYNDITPCKKSLHQNQELGRLIQNPESGKEAKPVPPAAMGQHQPMAFLTDSQA